MNRKGVLFKPKLICEIEQNLKVKRVGNVYSVQQNRFFK
jgi:hypothetical protein